MTDLRCTRCGRTASFADASIADSRRTCGGDGVPSEVEASDGTVRYDHSGGSKHDWEPNQ